MADAGRADDVLAAGRSALARGAWAEARSCFERALAHRETAEALEALSWAAWWLEDVGACLDARERAYRLYQQSGDRRSAARMALWLGDDHIGFRDAGAVADGWFRRAGRLLEGLDSGPEHGWLAVFEAHASLARHELAAARRWAAEAQDIGRRHGATDLEMFALATDGVARIEQGDVTEGLRRLDEATAAALSGDYENLVPAAWSCCLLMSSCEQVRDYARAAQWCQKIDEFSRRMGARFVTGVCRAHYGVIQLWQGRWDAAEQELSAALEDLTVKRPSWRAEALVRLGELRRRQGRLAEAVELFEQAAAHPLGQRGLAAVSLDRNDPAVARDLLERALRQLPPDATTGRADALELLVRAELALGEHEVAVRRLQELRTIAGAVTTAPLRAAVCLGDARVAATAGDLETACDHFEDAIDLFSRAGAAVEAAGARVELAGALVDLGRRRDAVREARLASAVLAEVGAATEAMRARNLLDQLAASRLAPESPLTTRQLEVLRLVADGLSDQDIAAELVLSEHTVHRHVANIYTRLGCSTRAAAVAQASRLGLL